MRFSRANSNQASVYACASNGAIHDLWLLWSEKPAVGDVYRVTYRTSCHQPVVPTKHSALDAGHASEGNCDCRPDEEYRREDNDRKREALQRDHPVVRINKRLHLEQLGTMAIAFALTTVGNPSPERRSGDGSSCVKNDPWTATNAVVRSREDFYSREAECWTRFPSPRRRTVTRELSSILDPRAPPCLQSQLCICRTSPVCVLQWRRTSASHPWSLQAHSSPLVAADQADSYSSCGFSWHRRLHSLMDLKRSVIRYAAKKWVPHRKQPRMQREGPDRPQLPLPMNPGSRIWRQGLNACSGTRYRRGRRSCGKSLGRQEEPSRAKWATLLRKKAQD